MCLRVSELEIFRETEFQEYKKIVEFFSIIIINNYFRINFVYGLFLAVFALIAGVDAADKTLSMDERKGMIKFVP